MDRRFRLGICFCLPSKVFTQDLSQYYFVLWTGFIPNRERKPLQMAPALCKTKTYLVRKVRKATNHIIHLKWVIEASLEKIKICKKNVRTEDHGYRLQCHSYLKNSKIYMDLRVVKTAINYRFKNEKPEGTEFSRHFF